VVILRSNFVNQSVASNDFNTRRGTVYFGSAFGGVSNSFEVAGTNLGATFDGFNNNFAIGTLNITNHLVLTNAYANLGSAFSTNEALYVDVLRLYTNATLKLSDLTIYVGNGFIDEWAGKTWAMGIFTAGSHPDGMDKYVFFDGGAIVLIPEPGTAALVLSGAGGLWVMRRRRR